MSANSTRVPTNQITRDRLRGWTEILRENHATPVLLVAVGHDERSSVVNVLVTEDCTALQLRAWLTAALAELA